MSVGGERVRLRLTNEYGTKPVTIGAARVALADSDQLMPGTEHVVAFDGRRRRPFRPDAALERPDRTKVGRSRDTFRERVFARGDAARARATRPPCRTRTSPRRATSREARSRRRRPSRCARSYRAWKCSRRARKPWSCSATRSATASARRRTPTAAGRTCSPSAERASGGRALRRRESRHRRQPGIERRAGQSALRTLRPRRAVGAGRESRDRVRGRERSRVGIQPHRGAARSAHAASRP